MEETKLLVIGLGFLLSVIFTFIAIKRLDKLGIIAKDLQKIGKPKRPKVGGIGIAAAFSISLLIAYYMNGSISYLVILLSFLTLASIGLIDDVLQFEKWRKLILPAFGAIPLLLLIQLEPFQIIFLFVAVSIASNWTNMLAGFNGLEAGMSAIMLFFLALSTPVENTALVLFIYSAVLIGFLVFNKYPSKIFPGDTGTLPVGAVLVGATLMGAPFYKLAILFIPHFLDALLKFASVGIISSIDVKPTEIRKGGLLTPDKSYLSLSRAIMHLKPLREWELVAIIWSIEIALGIVILLV